MEQTLRQFISRNLFESCNLLLDKLNIRHTQEEPTPMRFQDYYDSQVPQYIEKALSLTSECYYIGEVCDDAINEIADIDAKLADDLEKLKASAHYQSMMLFAVDLRPDSNVNRTDLSILTRAFNRLVYNFPVTVIFRHGMFLSIGTCERTEFKKEWKHGQGEKLGKVSLLRNIDCIKPHRGHMDILKGMECNDCSTFDKLYEKWKKVFSSELLTEKFYKELQNWYFWAVKNVAFPNDINDDSDDKLYNSENVIRLITRLMFVWFLKEKHLVNPDLFEEEKLRDILKDFNSKSEESNYYVGIIQNLFFATLNQEISKRRFIQPSRNLDKNYHNIKTYYRNQRLFIDENDEEKIISLFNQSPYVNGSLFECLDNKQRDGKTFYWDGFSQHKRFKNGMLKQAVVPNFLFFTEENGVTVDMHEEYGKEEPYYVRVSGIITILTKYHFTIEENTSLEEDIALDPELLGRAFENLLGAFNPETQSTARKNTGSYYTPRDVVNYMVRDSMLDYLKIQCPDIPENEIKLLLDYNVVRKPEGLSEKQSEEIVNAVYHCKILDPACGSGAFPMGVLQLLVSILRKLDENNKFWYKIVMEQAMADLKRIGSGTEKERQHLSDEINRTFEEKVNDPDYTRKLYIIEKCIYGVDIQTVAVQISRLRCFISLLCEQATCNDPDKNYGIKPLPNLETNFVAANTLVSLHLTNEEESLLREDEIIPLISKLRDIRHQLFMPRDNKTKRELKEQDRSIRDLIDEKIRNIYNVRLAEDIKKLDVAIADITSKLLLIGDDFDENQTKEVVEYDIFGNATTKIVKKANPKTVLLSSLRRAQEEKSRLQNTNMIHHIINKIRQLINWDPFDQNVSSQFFEPEWMFGVADGFDIVIGNPPYVRRTKIKQEDKDIYERDYNSATGQYDLYLLFIERGLTVLKNNTGILTYINPLRFFNADYGVGCRTLIARQYSISHILDVSQLSVFKSAMTYPCVLFLRKSIAQNDHTFYFRRVESIKDIHDENVGERIIVSQSNISNDVDCRFLIGTNEGFQIIAKVNQSARCLSTSYGVARGLPNNKVRFNGSEYDAIKSTNVKKYRVADCLQRVDTAYAKEFKQEMVVMPRTVQYLQAAIKKEKVVVLDRIYYLKPKGDTPLHIVLGLINSKLINYWFEFNYWTSKVSGNYFDLNGEQIESMPVILPDFSVASVIEQKVNTILAGADSDTSSSIVLDIDRIVYHLYGLTYDEVLVVDPETPITREKYESNE